MRWDPLRRFVVANRGCTGIFVEPLPAVFRRLQANYAYLEPRGHRFVNCAASRETGGELKLWTITDAYADSLTIEDALYFFRKSSADRDHVLRHLIERGQTPEQAAENLVCHAIPKYSVNDLLAEHWSGKSVDLLLCDAEGHDGEIIMGVDFERHRPKAILYESHNLGDTETAVASFLTGRGYVVERLAGDTVATLPDGQTAGNPATPA